MKQYDFGRIDSEYAYSGALGAEYSKNQTSFAVWSPEADSVTLNLYHTCRDAQPYYTEPLQKSGGVWQGIVSGDLNGVYYTYTVEIFGAANETIDIYARSAGVNGTRGMIFDPAQTNPAGWENVGYMPTESKTDAVIYELHIRDFSADISASFTNRGKFAAFCEKGVTNEHGDIVGLEYIASLGVTHIHLLPVADFASVDEDSDKPQFNWGYDPLNYNLPEGSYSTNPADGFARVREFKQLVAAAHSQGLGVIMDVVYNHTYDTDSPFGRIYPHYYYRHDKTEYSNGSGCGNEFASERVMARKFICDSLCYLMREYKLDGFRFDLMGLLDTETLNLCSKELLKINPCAVLYGEGWTGGSSPLAEEYRAVKKNASLVPQYSMFSDDFRDGVKGSVFSDTAAGYINGEADEHCAEFIKSVLCGGVYHPEINRPKSEIWTDDPAQSVNYVEAHDNLTFYDKLTLSMPNAAVRERIAADKLGAALVFLAQGVPFIQAGQELLRSKPSENGFVHDSYKSPDSVNCIKWNNVTENREVMEYYKGLIALRKRFSQLRLRTAEEIRARVHFEVICGGALIMRIDDLIAVINPFRKPIEVELKPCLVYADQNRAGAQPFGEVSGKTEVSPICVLIMQTK
ncbi:MAG: type I pullulanase [Oscillospiraceae bacterium]